MTVKLFPKNKRKTYRIWYMSIKQLYETPELWSNKAIVFADKTSNIYKLDNVGYEQGAQWLQAFAFCIVTVTDEHTKKKFKTKLKS